MQDWLEIMKRAGVFILIGEMIIYLAPGKEYEKYIRFLMDMLIVVILFAPILNLFGEGERILEPVTSVEENFDRELTEMEEGFAERLQQTMEDTAGRLENAQVFDEEYTEETEGSREGEEEYGGNLDVVSEESRGAETLSEKSREAE